jgi:hypothetical protein
MRGWESISANVRSASWVNVMRTPALSATRTLLPGALPQAEEARRKKAIGAQWRIAVSLAGAA